MAAVASRKAVVTGLKSVATLLGVLFFFSCASEPKTGQDDRIRQLESKLQKSVAAEITRGDLDIRTFRDVLIVSVKDSVLFAPDSAELRPESLDLLRQLGDVFKQAPDRVVVVEGNTAVARSSPEAMKLYPTSFHLGASRAANVVQFLQEKCGLDPSKLVASSPGQYRPRADNATEAGKAMNRRVDFTLVASALYY
jgi:chemotaxis protein MotB